MGLRLFCAGILLAAAVPAVAGPVSSVLLAPAPSASALPPPAARVAPAISSLLKPEALRRILEEREIVSNASLDDVPGDKNELRKYSYYASMLVHSSLSRTRELLTDYRAYARMVPYIDSADFVRAPDLIQIEGGIWKWKLRSQVLFEDRGRNWIHYRIVGGHFRGLEGDLLFESRGEKGTLVYMSGEQVGYDWPPKLVITKGAEIVFAFTAKRMRSYVEDQERQDVHQADPGGSQVPQPRSHL
jgi:hypothetical protein